MNHPLISEYIEAIKAAEDNFDYFLNNISDITWQLLKFL